MLQRIRRIASARRQKRETAARWQLDPAQLVWAVGSLCALNRIPFDPELLLKQFPPPYTTDTLIHAVRALGFRIKLKRCDASKLGEVATPCLVLLAADAENHAAAAGSEASSETRHRCPAPAWDS